MLEVRGVCKSYSDDGKYAIEDIDMKIEHGTIHGLIGHNGSGKTTIIKCLTGIFFPDKGDVLFKGQPVYNNNAVKEKIGYVADTNQMFRSYNVKKMAKFYEQVFPAFSMEDFESLSKLFLVDKRKKVSQMSKGQQMRASFVLNMARHPEIMILDEPTAGLDAMAKKELLDCLVNAVENEGMTVVISSHQLSELEKICDTVTMIKNGKIEIEDAVEEVAGQIVKYQIVFPEGAPGELYNRQDVCHMSNVGSVYQIILQGHVDGFEDEMKGMGATLVEEMPVGLEESFIYMNKGQIGGGSNE